MERASLTVVDTGARRGLKAKVLRGQMELGRIHTTQPPESQDHWKATCRIHRQCSCWLRCPERLEEGKTALIAWLGQAVPGDGASHVQQSVQVRLQLGMRARRRA